MTQPKLLTSDFYLTLPPAEHSPGDVWANIPVKIFGKTEFLNAVIITPSCDLAQEKTEVVNFVPLLSIDRYLCSKPFFGEVHSALSNIFKLVGGMERKGKFILPESVEIEAVLDILVSDIKKKEDCSKIREYLKYIRFCNKSDTEAPDISRILGRKKTDETIDKII